VSVTNLLAVTSEYLKETAMQFEISARSRVQVASVNVRSELHGQDHVPAIDVGVRFTTANRVLDQFEPGLRSVFYGPADGSPDQGELDGVAPISEMPKLKVGVLGPVKVMKEFAGYTLRIHSAITETVIQQCEVNKFAIYLKDGGSVELKFRIQAAGVDEATIGRVAGLLGTEVEVTLEAPAFEQQAIAEVTPIGKRKKKDKQAADPPSATDIFVGHAPTTSVGPAPAA
jgi:hypothetical protein